MKSASLLLIISGIFMLILGLVFLVAAADARTPVRLIIGFVMLSFGIYLLRMGLRRKQNRPVVISHDIHLSGDVNLEELTCSKCGAGLSPDNVSVRAGAVFASCPFCNSEYQIEEEPKW